ncbi:MAG: Alkaline phosphatase precursor [Candidatus Latescibacteria bacterium ADurb.Bin168]|nr:MAG: Alkaline phosphatase precursor [Candidatus Latescibacteria bacterium ADurb.Bin168]
MTTPGNHERESPNYYLSFEMPRNAPPGLQEKCFSFDVGQTHWISLNTQVDMASQTAWLEEDLKKTTKPWVFVFLHRPAYAAHASRGDGNQDVRDAWCGLFERYGVDAVWQGHDHYYHRSKPVRGGEIVPVGQGPVYITTGGAGAPLYQMKPNRYTEVGETTDHFCMMTLRGNHCEVVVYRADGSVLDRFAVKDFPRVTAR